MKAMPKVSGESKTTEPTKIPFTLHPRVFAALGADLVTSDVVAIIELVKNSYDAFATHVCGRTIPHRYCQPPNARGSKTTVAA